VKKDEKVQCKKAHSKTKYILLRCIMEAATLAMHKNVQVKRQCYFWSNSSYYTKVGSKVIFYIFISK